MVKKDREANYSHVRPNVSVNQMGKTTQRNTSHNIVQSLSAQVGGAPSNV